jgi:thiol:disulfide interchange protein
MAGDSFILARPESGKRPMFKTHLLLRLGLAAVALAASSTVWSQSPAAGNLLGSPRISFGGSDEGELDVSASVTKPARGEPARLVITAEIPDGWHTFSITQQPGGPLKTKIKLDASNDFKLAGDFKADPAPKVFKSAAYGDLPIETHEGKVTWSAPIELAAGADPSTLKVTGAVSSQRCFGEDKCLPPKSFKFTAAVEEATKKKESAAAAPPSQQNAPPADGGSRATRDIGSLQASSTSVAGPFIPKGTHATLRGWVEPAVATPGSVATLVISAEPTDGYHLYAFGDHDPKAVGIGKPTLIVLTDTSGLRYAPPEASAKPLEKPAEGVSGTIRYHETPVRWTIPIEIPAATKSGEYSLRGLIGIHTCNDAIGCDLPQGAEFQTTVVVGAKAVRGDGNQARFAPAAYGQIAAIAEQNTAAPKRDNAVAVASGNSAPSARSSRRQRTEGDAVAPPPSASEPMTLTAVVLFSLLGGLILNLMPCVLPVIGLKILSFVEQGGKSRGHVFALNFWYSLGLMAVFMVLAVLAVRARLAWGQHFQSLAFNVVLSAIVFTMALSFLGVWEIPIPGFVGSGKAVELAGREGAIGAFFKGVLTTVLATPCSGPFLGSVFGYALKQPPQVVYLTFGCIGLGMASPYLIIGAFPRLVRFLPKPGAWMETFKQIMGFVLLGTVVYLFSFMKSDYRVPTFALLIGLWAGCWWIGRIPITASVGRKARSWLVAGSVAAAVGVFAFTVLAPGPAVLDWKPFSQAKLKELTSQGKTVLVDFTADWCPTCKWNLRFYINTTEVRDLVQANEVVPLVADWTDESEDIKTALESLKSDSIPVLAVFPSGRPSEPIVLRDLLSRQAVIDALEQAGPSRKQGETVQQPKSEKAPGVASLR